MRELPPPAPQIYRQVRHCVAGFCNVWFAYKNRFAMQEDCEAIARVEAAALEQRFPVYGLKLTVTERGFSEEWYVWRITRYEADSEELRVTGKQVSQLYGPDSGCQSTVLRLGEDSRASISFDPARRPEEDWIGEHSTLFLGPQRKAVSLVYWMELEERLKEEAMRFFVHSGVDLETQEVEELWRRLGLDSSEEEVKFIVSNDRLFGVSEEFPWRHPLHLNFGFVDMFRTSHSPKYWYRVCKARRATGVKCRLEPRGFDFYQ
jgi:hypothetical protein